MWNTHACTKYKTTRSSYMQTCLTLWGAGCRAKWAATVYSAATGRGLDLFTNAPGLQLYTGNHLDGTTAGPPPPPSITSIPMYVGTLLLAVVEIPGPSKSQARAFSSTGFLFSDVQMSQD